MKQERRTWRINHLCVHSPWPEQVFKEHILQIVFRNSWPFNTADAVYSCKIGTLARHLTQFSPSGIEDNISLLCVFMLPSVILPIYCNLQGPLLPLGSGRMLSSSGSSYMRNQFIAFRRKKSIQWRLFPPSSWITFFIERRGCFQFSSSSGIWFHGRLYAISHVIYLYPISRLLPTVVASHPFSKERHLWISMALLLLCFGRLYVIYVKKSMDREDDSAWIAGRKGKWDVM